MRVILKQTVENLGKKGDIVNVTPGYGRNYLIPKKIALEVTSSNMKMIEIEQRALQKAVEKERASFQGVIDKLNETTLLFKRKAGEKDVIFGSVSSSDIKDALQELSIEIDKKKILLDEPIKRLGNYTVPIKIFHEDRAEVKVEVISEEEEGAEKLEDEKVKEETLEEAEAAPVEPEEERKDLEAQEEEKKDTEKIVEKEDAIVEEKGEPETQKDEAEAKQEEKDEMDETSVEKTGEPTEKAMHEEVQEDVVQEKEEAPEKKAGEEAPKPEKKKEKKEKKEKKKEKK